MTDIVSFLKGNVGEEDVIKTLLLSAGKALVSVAILLGGLLSYFMLCKKIGFEATTLSIIVLTIFMMYNVSRGITSDLIKKKLPEMSIRNYKTWYHSIDGLTLWEMFYFDVAKVKVPYYEDRYYRDLTEATFEVYHLYIRSWIKSIVQLFVTYIIGVIIIFSYAYLISSSIYIDAPLESWITIGTIIGSIIGLSYLFLKLKWKKIITKDGINWNLAAWCICAAVIVTMIAFIAGVAIRNIAGFIGIEYTAILVSSYIILTTIYVYIDIRQWIDRKKREEEIKIEIKREEEDRKIRDAQWELEKKEREEREEKINKLISDTSP